MLVYEQDSNILALLGEAIECSLDIGGLGLCVDDQEVLLRVRGLCHVLCILLVVVACRCTRGELTPTPASSMPVTVSWMFV